MPQVTDPSSREALEMIHHIPAIIRVLELSKESDLIHISANSLASQYFSRSESNIVGLSLNQLQVSERVIQKWLSHCLKAAENKTPCQFLLGRFARETYYSPTILDYRKCPTSILLCFTRYNLGKNRATRQLKISNDIRYDTTNCLDLDS